GHLAAVAVLDTDENDPFHEQASFTTPGPRWPSALYNPRIEGRRLIHAPGNAVRLAVAASGPLAGSHSASKRAACGYESDIASGCMYESVFEVGVACGSGGRCATPGTPPPPPLPLVLPGLAPLPGGGGRLCHGEWGGSAALAHPRYAHLEHALAQMAHRRTITISDGPGNRVADARPVSEHRVRAVGPRSQLREGRFRRPGAHRERRRHPRPPRARSRRYIGAAAGAEAAAGSHAPHPPS